MAQIIAKRGLIVTMGTAARRSNFVPESRFDILKEHLSQSTIIDPGICITIFVVYLFFPD